MSALLTADIHVTESQRDEHRWGLWKWLRKAAEKYEATHVFVAGDITDAKDRHSARLVNRLVDEIQRLSLITEVWLLKGNHDYLDESNPFFEFINNMDAKVHFVTAPADAHLFLPQTKHPEKTVLLLPSTRDYEKAWEGIDFDEYDYIITHQTYMGSRVENGSLIEGLPPSVFGGYRGRVFSGDVHVPQKIGKNIEYIGAPYHCHFGDVFEPRVLLLDNAGKTKDLHYDTKRKYQVEITGMKALRELDAAEGDQVKVKVKIKRRDMPNWPKLREEITALAEDRKWELFGPELKGLLDEKQADEVEGDGGQRSGAQRVRDYSDSKRFDRATRDLGLSFLKSVEN